MKGSAFKKILSIVLTVLICLLHMFSYTASLFICDDVDAGLNYGALTVCIAGLVIVVIAAVLLRRSNFYFRVPCDWIFRLYALAMLAWFVKAVFFTKAVDGGTQLTISSMFARIDTVIIFIAWVIVPILLFILTLFRPKKLPRGGAK